MIKLFDVNMSYKNCTALSCVSLEIHEGVFVAITGESGSGKSTLLSVMSGLQKPTTGLVTYNGEDIYKKDKFDMIKFRRYDVAFVFQNYNLISEYTVRQNVEIPLIFRKEKKYESKILEVLKQVDLLDKIDEKVKNLSGGEQQRCAIARALIISPKVLFADEPCGNLDSINSKKIMNILLSLKETGKTIVMVTHNINDANLCDRIVVLRDGRIVEDNANDKAH